MVNRRRITDLPPEIRRQIFGDYFKVSGGYIYDGKSDKLRNADETPIDLSLIYTCRLIAEDCRNLPLAVNTIHFHTLYREDWRSLAGCFNLAATYYNLLQQGLVLHLAHLITPDIHDRLQKDFPTFKSKLEAEREFHFNTWHAGEGASSANPVIGDHSNSTRPVVCKWILDFLEFNVSNPIEKAPRMYHGFGDIHEAIEHSWRDGHADGCDYAYKRWDWGSGDVHRCLTRCLRLIADRSPEEFGNHIYAYLPHWVGKYPAESFFDLRFEYWAIPERYQVSNVLDLLGISSLVWKLPDMWYYSGDFMYKSRDRHTPDQLSDELDRLENPRSDFEIRVREKIRFSATAAAIRFLGLIPDTERTGIRTIIIHEDFPSVNRPPLHGNGLIPFLQENTLLRIERRIHVVDTIFHACSGPEEMTERLTQGPLSGIDDSRVDELFTWLLDALAVGSRDIPVGSLTLLLESGPRSNICTEIFQELIHARFALGQAVRECSETGILRSLTSRQTTWLKREFGFENEFSEAINQLVSQRSDILRCDFSPGLPQSHQAIVDAVKEAADVWDYFRDFIFRDLDKPDDWESEGWNTEMYEIQTQDDYLRSLSRS